MKVAPPVVQSMNRTFIGSVLFIDIVGYSRRTVPDQLAMKELFNTLLADAIQNVAPSDRIMVDTGDGAAIAFIGDPEDALFAALSLRDAIDSGRANLGEPGFVRMGINLGPLKAVRDINGHTNMIGDGVNDAQRVMSFADPGQVIVSHSYYDIISRFSHDYAKLFVYEGTRHDKHVREHEVYRFGPPDDTENLAEKLRDRSRARGAEDAQSKQNSTTGETSALLPHPKKQALHVGLIGLLIGTATMVSAVWSWTSAPDNKQETAASENAALPAAAATTAPVSDRASTSSAGEAAAARSAKESSAKPAETAKIITEEIIPTIEKKVEPPVVEAKPGVVKFAIHPWGEIYVNGSRRGISPPVKSLNLAPGKYKIEVRNGQFAPYTDTVEVKSGANTTVRYTF